MMGVDDPRTTQRTPQAWRDWVRGMAAQPARGTQRSDPQSTNLVHYTPTATKRDQLALDLSAQSARQLEWVAFTTAE
jgi:hypothetical protein